MRPLPAPAAGTATPAAAVEAKGVPVDYPVFDDEGHGFAKKKNEAEAFRRIVEFLDKHLKG